MNTMFKTILLAIYCLAVLTTIVAPALVVTTVLQYAAIILVAAHVLEALVALPYLGRHPGPFVDSVALTVLFGMLHWLPLKKRGAGKS
jgi:hypothetical protein